jgi:hypothetical protein
MCGRIYRVLILVELGASNREFPRCVTTAFKPSDRGLRRLATNSSHVTLVPAHAASLRRKTLEWRFAFFRGTELAFSSAVTKTIPRLFARRKVENLGHATAIFRQVNKTELMTHHDALEFPDGRIVLLTKLSEGQEATVLQLPAQPTTVAEVDAQKRVAHVG